MVLKWVQSNIFGCKMTRLIVMVMIQLKDEVGRMVEKVFSEGKVLYL